MYASPKQDDITEAQRIRDAALLARIKRDLIDPFLSDVEARYPGYDAMTFEERASFLYEQNKPCKGTGNSAEFLIPCGACGYSSVVVYSGEESFISSDVPDGKSLYEFVMHAARDRLDPCYTAALIMEIIDSDVIVASPIDAEKFALCGDTPRTLRYSMGNVYNSLNEITGYTLRIRDTYPSNTLMLGIAHDLRNVGSFEEDIGAHVDGSATDTAKRSRWKDADLMVDFIDNLALDGKLPKRGSETTWDEVNAWLTLEYPDIDYHTGRNLSRCYHSAKRRREMADTIHPRVDSSDNVEDDDRKGGDDNGEDTR